jgi:hypothetical protein
MPRYFFNVHNVSPSTDQIGEELPDDEAAWRAATMFAGELFKDIDGKFRPGQGWSLEVIDEATKPLFWITTLLRNAGLNLRAVQSDAYLTGEFRALVTSAALHVIILHNVRRRC